MTTQAAEKTATRSGMYIPGLDGLRFLAFFLVLINHLSKKDVQAGWAGVQHIGWSGVELFFVLSAFLLTKLAVEETNRQGRVAIKKFFIRRILRIWPLYYLFVFAYFGYFMIHNHVFTLLLPRVLGLLTFTDNIWSAVTHQNNIASSAHLWSISMEEQFYLLLPLLIPLLVRKSRQTQLIMGGSVLAFLLVMRVIAVYQDMTFPFIYNSPLGGDAFIVGILLGLGAFDAVLRRIPPLLEFAAGVALLGSLVAMPWFQEMNYVQIVAFPIAAFGYMLMVDAIANHSSRLLEAIFANRVTRYLGKISFGLYVWHYVILNEAEQQFEKVPALWGYDLAWYIRMAAILAVTILVSVASYELYEKRFLRLKSRFTVVQSRPV